MSELPKTYDPKSVEDKLYKFWVDSGFFHAEVNPDKKPYTIVIPPPNVTGQLHMGHAFDETLQDILIRTKRMQGYEALWMPFWPIWAFPHITLTTPNVDSHSASRAN